MALNRYTRNKPRLLSIESKEQRLKVCSVMTVKIARKKKSAPFSVEEFYS